MPIPRRFATSLVAACLFALFAASRANAGDFVPLFDGKSLDGWNGDQSIFRVEEGAIVGGSLNHRIEHNEFLCTNKEYENFELKLKAKLKGAGHNAGVQFRSARVPDESDVVGYQYDIGRDSDSLIWGLLYDESRRRKYLADCDRKALQQAVYPDDWNNILIRCEGSRIQMWVNDFQTVDFQETDPDVSPRGVIGLQIHGGPPAEAWYKEIMIRER